MIGTHSQDGNCIFLLCSCYYWCDESVASEWKCPGFGLISLFWPVQTKEKQEQKQKISEEKQKRSKNKRETSKEKFAFARCERTFKFES